MIFFKLTNKCKKYLFLYTEISMKLTIRNYLGQSIPIRISALSNHQQCHNYKTELNVLFFGSDSFSLESLRRLQNSLSTKLLLKLEVVTSFNSAKDNDFILFNKKHNIKVHSWPIKSPISGFDIGIIVSFGHLIPEWVIQSFPLGMINVHASLLPRWRGASPIIYSLIHGDTTTGISIIKIKPKKFDTGDILAETTIPIHPDETQPQLHNKMACIGAELLINTIEQLPDIINNGKPQSDDNATYAPKITPEISLVNWNRMTAVDVYNLQRALVGIYPLITYYNGQKIKLHDIQRCDESNLISSHIAPGLALYNKKRIIVQCQDGQWVSVREITMAQRRRMTATDFHNGFMRNYRKREIIFTSKNNT